MSRTELIKQLSRIIGEIRDTSISELCLKGNYAADPTLRYPQTKGEYLADMLSTLLASQSWIDGESEPVLDELLEHAGHLDRNVDQPEVWRDIVAHASDIK